MGAGGADMIEEEARSNPWSESLAFRSHEDTTDAIAESVLSGRPASSRMSFAQSIPSNPSRAQYRSVGGKGMIRFIIGERTVFTVIVINAVALFLDSFSTIHEISRGALLWIDYVCVLFFLLEIVLKVREFTWGGYWSNSWNQFDFTVVAISLPVLLSPFFDLQGFSVFLVLRLSRLLRLFKIVRFIPNGELIAAGLIRSLKASVSVFAALFFLNLLFALGATMIFGDELPEHFGNPVISIYTLFRVFTVEGWYEIPDLLLSESSSSAWAVLVRGYFAASVLIGGILGLSLANAVFVDEMTADNTKDLEAMIGELSRDVAGLREELQARGS